MYQFASNPLPKLLLLMVLPLAGCAGDNMFADESISAYGGSKQHPIKIVNGQAVVDDCGDWSKNAADTETNELSPNHGCAVQANIAAMAAYPNDLVKSRRAPKGLGWTHESALINLTEAAAAGGGSSGGSSSTTAAKP